MRYNTVLEVAGRIRYNMRWPTSESVHLHFKATYTNVFGVMSLIEWRKDFSRGYSGAARRSYDFIYFDTLR